MVDLADAVLQTKLDVWDVGRKKNLDNRLKNDHIMSTSVIISGSNERAARMGDPLGLAELLATRLCQEFSGPIKALDAALSGLRGQDQGQNARQALAAARGASAELAQRFALACAAWGNSQTELDLAALLGLALGPLAARRVRLDASGLSADTVLSSAMAQVVLNVLLLAADSLPRGGTVALVDAAEGEMLATLAGPRAAWPEGFAACLTDEAAAWAALDGPGNLLGPLAALLAFRASIRLSLLLPAGRAGRGAPPLLIAPAGQSRD